MKPLPHHCRGMLLVILAGLVGCVQRQDLAIVLAADGSARIRYEVTCERKAFTAMINEMQENGVFEVTPLPDPKPDGTPVTEEDRLIQRVEAMIRALHFPEAETDAADPGEPVEVEDLEDLDAAPLVIDPPPAAIIPLADPPPAALATAPAVPPIDDPPVTDPPAVPPPATYRATFETLEVTDTTVHLVLTASFDDPITLFTHCHSFLRQINVQGWRLELDETGRLQSTMTTMPQEIPLNQRRHWTDNMRQWFAQTPVAGSISIEMPGAITASTLPSTEGHVTRVDFDTSKTDDVDTLAAIFDSGVIVVAEKGDLDPDLFPMEMAEPGRSPRQGTEINPYAAAPVGKSIHPFRVVPQQLTTTFSHRFPAPTAGGAGADPTVGRSSCHLLVTFLAPEDRTILRLGRFRVVAARDDQGRAITPVEADTSTLDVFRESGPGREAPVHQGNLDLALPLPDATAIERLDGEVEAVTCAGWQHQDITPTTTGNGTPIDLGLLIPGATLNISTWTVETRDRTVEARLVGQITGPAEIARLTIVLGHRNNDNVDDCSPDDDSTRQHQGSYLRNITITMHEWSDSPIDAAELSLRLAVPTDVRRETGTFTLTGLDLL